VSGCRRAQAHFVRAMTLAWTEPYRQTSISLFSLQAGLSRDLKLGASIPCSGVVLHIGKRPFRGSIHLPHPVSRTADTVFLAK